MAGSDENGRPVDAEELEDQAQETGEHPVLDPETQARRERALALIRTFGDPALRASAVDVTRFDDSLREEVARMEALMGDALGLGLAATQLGVMHRLFVFRVGADAPLVAVVNPRLEWSSQDQETAEEGCLSLPRVLVDVERPLHVRVQRPGRARRADRARGLRARGARDPARDGPPRRGPDPRSRHQGAAQGSAARPARRRASSTRHEPSASARSAG